MTDPRSDHRSAAATETAREQGAAARPVGARSVADIQAVAGRGGALFVTRNLLIQGLQIASAIVVARLITPDLYGAFAVAAILAGFARTLGDLGVSQALIARPRIGPTDLPASAFITCATAILGGSLAVLVALLLDATVLAEPAMAMTAAMSGALLVDAFRVGPIIRTQRDLRFKAVAAVTLIESLALYLAQVALLLVGFGIWALVLAQYARSIAGVLAYRKVGGSIVRPAASRHVLALVSASWAYQGPLILTGLAGAVLPLMVAASLGSEQLGYWAWGTILAVPIAQTLIAVQAVLMPSFSRMLEHGERAADASAELTARLLAVGVGVLAGGLVGLAPALVTYVFGERWEPATPAVQLYVIGVVPLVFVHVVVAVMDAHGEARRRLRAAVASIAAGLFVTYPLIRLAGIEGAVVATSMVVPLVDLLLLCRGPHPRLGRAFRNAALAFLIAAVAAAGLERTVHSLTDLVLATAMSGVVMAMVAATVDADVTRRAWRVLRRETAPQP